MKVDKKLIIGAAAAGLTAVATYLGSHLNTIPAEIITGIVAAIAWLAAWLNGRDNTQ